MRSYVRDIKGFATIALSLALLFAASLMVIFASKTTLIEQKVSSNFHRVLQAFEASEAGLNIGVMHLNANSDTVIVDSDGDGLMDSYTNGSITNAFLPNGSSFTVTYSNMYADDFAVIEVTSVGSCADGSVSRTTREIYATQPVLDDVPENPFTVKESVSLGGNARITNMYGSTTIWSGEAVDLSGSADTMTASSSSDARTQDLDIDSNDSILSSMSSDYFFERTFSGTKDSIKSRAHLLLSGTGNDNYSDTLDGQEGKVIWIEQSSGEARINGDVTIGSADNPVILIVNGALQINGSATVYGIVYVGQDWQNSGGGSMQVNGAAIVEGDFSGTGTPSITYSPSVLDTLSNQGSSYSKLPGSWKDF